MYNLLVMDDEFFMCEALKQIIHTSCPDFQVTHVAYNGQDGLELVMNHSFAAIITDIRMPKMDGLSFLQRLREKGNDTPVIIITGHSEFEYTRKALRLGAIDYILKPLERGEIVSVLSDLSERFRKDSGDEKEKRWNASLTGSELIQSIIEYMEEHYQKDLSIAFFSEKTGYNQSYISRLFKLEAGINFLQLLTEVRIRHAKELLYRTELPVFEIGSLVGYPDNNHFGRVFKKEVGLPPGEYREQMRSNN